MGINLSYTLATGSLSSFGIQSFQSRGYGILGTSDSGGIVYYRSPERRHTTASEFDVESINQLPRVDIVLTYQDAPGDLITNAVNAGAAGLIVSGAGAGATSRRQTEAIQSIVEEGIPVVLTSRAENGRVPAESLLSKLGSTEVDHVSDRIAGEDLSAVKARILLMLALTETTNSLELQRIFSEY